MAGILVKERFQESDINLPEIQNFFCGPEAWDQEVAAWIKSPFGGNSVLESMRTYQTSVWLYRTPEKELVGFGSLGEQLTSYPPPKGKKRKLHIIPFFGIGQQFQGEPKSAPREDRYAYRILEDIVAEAAANPLQLPAIGLSVDRRNKKAIRFYENFGFINALSSHTDNGVVYDRMYLVIDQITAVGGAPQGTPST